MSKILWPDDARLMQSLAYSYDPTPRMDNVRDYVVMQQEKLSGHQKGMIQDCFDATDETRFWEPLLKPDPLCEGRVRKAIYRGAEVLSALCFEVIHEFLPSLNGAVMAEQRWSLINNCFRELFSNYLDQLFDRNMSRSLSGSGEFRTQIGSMESANKEICNAMLAAVTPILLDPENSHLSRKEVLAKARWNSAQCRHLQALVEIIVRYLKGKPAYSAHVSTQIR